MGRTTCHRLTGGQRSGHQGDQLGMCLPKLGVGTGRSVTQLLLYSPLHIGETEAQNSTSWPGSPSIRPQTTNSTLLREDGVSWPPAPARPAAPGPPPPPWPPTPAGKVLEQKARGAGPGQAGGRGGGYKGRWPGAAQQAQQPRGGWLGPTGSAAQPRAPSCSRCCCCCCYRHRRCWPGPRGRR